MMNYRFTTEEIESMKSSIRIHTINDGSAWRLRVMLRMMAECPKSKTTRKEYERKLDLYMSLTIDDMLVEEIVEDTVVDTTVEDNEDSLVYTYIESNKYVVNVTFHHNSFNILSDRAVREDSPALLFKHFYSIYN